MAGILAVILIVAADQVLKHWVTANISMGERMTLIPGVLGITKIHNYGASFGLLQNMRWLFLIGMAVFIVAAVYLLITWKVKPAVQRWALIAVIGGGLGNALDRILTGYVVDMFEFTFMNFAVFNVADVFIVCGAILFCIHYIYWDFRSKKGLKDDQG